MAIRTRSAWPNSSNSRTAILPAPFAVTSAPVICAPRAFSSSSGITGKIYHVGGIEREVGREIWSRRSEEEMFTCLAWLYDGFTLPQSRVHKKDYSIASNSVIIRELQQRLV